MIYIVKLISFLNVRYALLLYVILSLGQYTFVLTQLDILAAICVSHQILKSPKIHMADNNMCSYGYFLVVGQAKCL
jgi:hypothetical protein